MYSSYFGLTERPFSITPDPRFLFMSERHREALAHLVYGAGPGGGFVQLTGEVGTGKTTVCRALIEQLPSEVDVALILNPALTVIDLLITICQELHIPVPRRTDSTRELIEPLNAYLLDAHARGRRTVLIIDEAQNLTEEVMEQVRLLTNLETDRHKLLQIFLIGQPELRGLLDRRALRQVAQRITARYHLTPLTLDETHAFIRHRLGVAGCGRALFEVGAVREVYRWTSGVPRLINIVCDRALLGAYGSERQSVDARTVRNAAREVLGQAAPGRLRLRPAWVVASGLLALAFVGGALGLNRWLGSSLRQPVFVVEPGVGSAGMRGAAEGRVDRAPAAAVREPPVELAAASPALRTEIEGVAQTGPLPMVEGPAADEPEESAAPLDLETWLSTGAGQEGEGFGFDIAVRSRLAALWQRSYDPAASLDLCQWAREQGLQCLDGTGTWNHLRRLNRPAVIDLFLPDGQRRSALVTGLRGDEVALDRGDDSAVFALPAVDQYWYGRYRVVWKLPFDGVRVLRPGHRGPEILWLRERFAEIDGEQDAGADDRFDDALARRVREFQRDSFLTVDGIVGARTLAHLCATTGDPSAPSLAFSETR
jgi:general secretion pathway protein A